jgi:glycosyltransferase involved in cell wall biosynthesis
MYSESSLIVPSRHLLGYFDKAKCHVIAINNPVNVDAVIEAASEVGQGNLRMPEAAVLPDKLHVCWNSNVMQSKGFGFAVNSCERLVEAGYHIHFHIFGAPMGDSLRSKQQMSSALNKVMSAPWATYYGQVSRPEMLRAVARADVVVLPTSHPSESQGLAVVEAMALGCQVIASNTEVMRTTTEGYPAVLVAPSDPDALDRALLAAHSKKHKFRASAGVSSHYIREKFSEKNFSRKIINVILTGQNY